MQRDFRIATDNAEGPPERRTDPLDPDEEARSSGAPSAGAPPDPQVPAKAKRRTFSASEIEKHLAALDKLGRGDHGAYCRQHGLYSSQIADWRKKRTAGLQVKRGPAAQAPNPLAKQLAEKDRRIAELERRLKRADLLLEIQKKAQEVLATFPERGQGSDGTD
jgi:transposase-like protein